MEQVVRLRNLLPCYLGVWERHARIPPWTEVVRLLLRRPCPQDVKRRLLHQSPMLRWHHPHHHHFRKHHHSTPQPARLFRRLPCSLRHYPTVLQIVTEVACLNRSSLANH